MTDGGPKANTVLTRHDRHAAADLLTQAFFDNPAHAFIFPDPTRRQEQLRWLMYTNLGGQLAVEVSFAEKSADAFLAMAFWHAPGAPKASLFQLARFGFFAMPLKYGWPAFNRMTKTVAEFEKRRANGLGGRESWFLNNMVVAHAQRGKGIGTRLLQQQLADVVDPSGFPASLTTQKPENGSVKPNAFGGDFHDLLGERPDIEGARSPRLVLCLFKKAMAAARNRERGEGEARSGAFGLTTPSGAIKEVAGKAQDKVGNAIKR